MLGCGGCPGIIRKKRGGGSMGKGKKPRKSLSPPRKLIPSAPTASPHTSSCQDCIFVCLAIPKTDKAYSRQSEFEGGEGEGWRADPGRIRRCSSSRRSSLPRTGSSIWGIAIRSVHLGRPCPDTGCTSTSRNRVSLCSTTPPSPDLGHRRPVPSSAPAAAGPPRGSTAGAP